MNENEIVKKMQELELKAGKYDKVCPKCKSEVDNVVIVKGYKSIGINFFCKKMGCNYEICNYEIDRRFKKNNDGGQNG